MSSRLFAFGLWCMTMFSASAAASYFAWSPYADNDRSPGMSLRGPSHK